MAGLNLSKPADVKCQESSKAFGGYSCYLLLFVPIILFVGSLYIPPRMSPDSGVGFLALRSMFDGRTFNTIATPDPLNIANDIVTFLSWWSPGQYLVPGIFIWLGANYGLALSLTALIATLIGVAGWIQIARSFAVSSSVLFVFALGLNTFPYVTEPFHGYTGGDLLLFATAPWSLLAMRWSVNKAPVLCFAISLLSAALLFLAKLTGLIVFAANVVAISLLSMASQRRLTSSAIAMWAASGTGILFFMMFWDASFHVLEVPASGSTFTFSWFPISVSVTGAVFSGIYGRSLFLGHPWLPINFERANLFLGLVGLLLMVWVWCLLRHTRYRAMAVQLLTIILVYTIVVATMYLRHSDISFEDRHFLYAGILFFLLLLTALDQWRVPSVLTFAVVMLLGFYSLINYARFAYAQMRAGYDPMCGISQDIVPPATLEYMRSEVARHNFQRPIAVIPSPSATVCLPGFRIIAYEWGVPWNWWVAKTKRWPGRAEKIFVVIQEGWNAEPLLRAFTDYDFNDWTQMKLHGIIVYTQ